MRCADHALEYRKLADIKPYQKNPRKNDKAVTAVANSIREYGFQSPIIVDRDGVITPGIPGTRQQSGCGCPPCL